VSAINGFATSSVLEAVPSVSDTGRITAAGVADALKLIWVMGIYLDDARVMASRRASPMNGIEKVARKERAVEAAH